MAPQTSLATLQKVGVVFATLLSSNSDAVLNENFFQLFHFLFL